MVNHHEPSHQFPHDSIGLFDHQCWPTEHGFSDAFPTLDRQRLLSFTRSSAAPREYLSTWIWPFPVHLWPNVRRIRAQESATRWFADRNVRLADDHFLEPYVYWHGLRPLIAPVIGGFINFHFGWSMVFISLLGYVSLAWIIIAFRFKETITRRSAIPSPAKMLVQYRDLLSSRYFMSFASISWLNFSLMITTVSVMPFIMQDQIGMTSDEYAMWALIPALGMLGGTTICNRIRPVIGNKKMLLCTPVLHISAALWLFFCPVEPLYLMIGQLLMILGNGIALPCAQALVMQPYKEQAGAAAAMSGGGQMVVSSLVSMTLVQLGLSEAWHLSLVVVLFTAITLTNILRGFNTEEAQQHREVAEKAS